MATILTRHEWAADLLTPATDDRVLEIGCGPGVTLSHVCDRLGPRGRITGIDRSAAALAAAQRRNRTQVAAGKVAFRRGVFAELDLGRERFDKIYAFNVSAFLTDTAVQLAAVKAVLKRNGAFFFFHQAPVAGKAEPVIEQFARALAENGFVVEAMRRHEWKPAAVFGVVARVNA